jgi:GH24 family phage-related lysozyme (muramidase)/peptidoglycan hydrolase-like protein with peptidoglycan-binding domain
MIIHKFYEFLVESNEFKRILKKGDYGDDVKGVQKKLGIEPADGDFGQKTHDKVVSWQKSKGLEGTGIIGRREWSILFPQEKDDPRKILDGLEGAVSGPGTDEEGLVRSILLIKSKETIYAINNILKGEPDKWSYKNFEDYFRQELGWFDGEDLEKISKHLKNIGVSNSLTLSSPPNTNIPTPSIIINALDSVTKHEAFREKVYPDPLKGWKIPTIGYGFNMAREDAASILSKLGLNFNLLRKGKQTITEEQAKEIAKKDLEKSYDYLKTKIENLESHPLEVQSALCEIMFNVGPGSFSKFQNFIKYINQRKYSLASKELKNSSWSKQVGRRALELSDKIASAG